ncbi:hypothetical protein [Labilibaculum euxinus]|uniref:RHS repeat protein n=1 Tax=Labilibaculum euxinus TaxID=2686357 RepID=A0A7M4D4I3_9BACT|nr:hypothetical protein [Labilibaculum euxinus]MUP37562.1 hypothetical protein [Labilibaculum euxinus]MVB06767.1 hypothetical protein [Labilibaculum euxinus]
MKVIKSFFLLTLLCALCYSCSDSKDEPDLPPEPGKGILSISPTESSNTKSSAGTSYELSDLVTAVITIEQNNVVLEAYNSKEITLEKWGDKSYTIKGIELEEGSNYSITAFKLKNEEDNTTFASPITGSTASAWVNESLPISFTIDTDKTTEVDLQVVTTLGSKPSDFGYHSFTFSDNTPGVQSYLENIETIFLDKNEKIVHHFTQRGIPTYSEIYRNHIINKHISIDIIAETIKHYYTGDGVFPKKVIIERHISKEASMEYLFTEHYESGNIAKMESNSEVREFDDNGLPTKYISLNSAGVPEWHVEYSHNDKGYLESKHYFDIEGIKDYSYNYTYDDEGNQISKSRVNSDGTLLPSQVEYEYINGLMKRTIYYSVNENQEKEEYAHEDFEYNSDNLLVKESMAYTSSEIVNTLDYIYSGNKLVSSEARISTDPDFLKIYYYDDLGWMENENSNKIYDFRGHLIEDHYVSGEYKIVELYDDDSKISEKKIYSMDGVLLKSVQPENNNAVINYWDNGFAKSETFFNNNFDILFYQNMTNTEFDTHNPTESDQFELLNHVRYHINNNESGVMLSRVYLETMANDEYSSGIIIRAVDEQYAKEKADYSVVKRVYTYFYYSQYNSTYADPNDLYKYVVVVDDLVTGEMTSTYYDANGNKI